MNKEQAVNPDTVEFKKKFWLMQDFRPEVVNNVSGRLESKNIKLMKSSVIVHTWAPVSQVC